MDSNSHPFQLPDGRVPLRYGKGRTAVYIKARGEGTVEYPFSMIKYLREKRPRKPISEVRAIRLQIAQKHKEEDPDYYKKLGRKGGKVTKDERRKAR